MSVRIIFLHRLAKFSRTLPDEVHFWIKFVDFVHFLEVSVRYCFPAQGRGMLNRHLRFCRQWAWFLKMIFMILRLIGGVRESAFSCTGSRVPNGHLRHLNFFYFLLHLIWSFSRGLLGIVFLQVLGENATSRTPFLLSVQCHFKALWRCPWGIIFLDRLVEIELQVSYLCLRYDRFWIARRCLSGFIFMHRLREYETDTSRKASF